MRVVLACLVLFAASEAAADQPLTSGLTPAVRAAFEPLVFFDKQEGDDQPGFKLPYRLMAPDVVHPGEERPLLLFLHGFGERGDDNLRQLIHGGPMFASDAFHRRHRAFVVAPQCPAGTEPGTVSENPNDPPGTEAQRVWTHRLKRGVSPPIDVEREPTAQLQAVIRLVDHLIETRPIDPDRVYVAGLSMGGYATWELITRDPQRWAAAAPICGAGDPGAAERVKDLPIWVHHGDRDGAIPVARSREMVAAINAARGRVVYSEYPHVGHDSWTPTFQSRHVWDWLFAQRR